MTELELQEKIDSELNGISITKEQAILALESIMSIKCNELLFEGYLYRGKEFSESDIRYEYLALQIAHDLLEKEIIRDKARGEVFEKEE